MPVARTQAYCLGCQRKHRGQFLSSGLGDGEVYSYCKKVYDDINYLRNSSTEFFLFHPCWVAFKAALSQIDNTGCAIHSLKFRADLGALASLDALAQSSKNGMGNNVWAHIFCFVWLFPVLVLPDVVFVARREGHRPRQDAKAGLDAMWR